jgi:hypothetical protein
MSRRAVPKEDHRRVAIATALYSALTNKKPVDGGRRENYLKGKF